MTKPNLSTAILLGIILGYGCAQVSGRGGPDATAHDLIACNQWDFDRQDHAEPIPEGWEPFAWEACSAGYSCLAIRRCAD